MTLEYKIKGGITLIDSDDLELINTYSRWRVSAKGYAMTYKCAGGKTSIIYMHRLIMRLPPNKPHVDHINHIKLDNRKINLRACTPLENSRNASPRGETKYLGVSYQTCKYKDRTYKYLKAKIRVNSKLIHLGTFTDEKDAALAYNEAAKKYFGEFANLNVV